MTWVNCKLSEFCDIIMGQSPPSTSYNTNGDGLPFFQGKAEFGELYPQIQKYCNKPKKIAERNDILLSVRAPVGPTNIAPEKSCIGRGLAAIRALDSVNYRYVFYLLRSKQIYLSGQGTGTTFRAITKDFLYDLNIAISPLPEQAQVISMIEQLFSDLDNAIENLQKAKDQLKVYRQSVLKYAFEGKLTEEWRKNNDEPISAWKRDEYFKSIRKYSINGKKIKEKEYSKRGALPVIDQGQDLIGGYTDNMTCRMKCELPVIVFGDHTKVVKFINFDFAPGADGTKVIRADERFNPKLFFYFTLYLSKLLPDKGYARHFQHFKEISVPIPPMSEQEIIIQKIESRFSVSDKMEETIENSLKQAEALRQSILKQAFEGKLTEKWRKEHPELISGENSAKALLEKVKAEREVLENTRKRKR